MILDIDRIFSGAELAGIMEAGDSAGGEAPPAEKGEAVEAG
jgi:hypothetical protein